MREKIAFIVVPDFVVDSLGLLMYRPDVSRRKSVNTTASFDAKFTCKSPRESVASCLLLFCECQENYHLCDYKLVRYRV